MLIENVNHFSFTVSDLERSLKFYQEVLGLDVTDISERDMSFSERVTGVPGAHLRIAYLKLINVSVELIQYLAPGGIKIDTSTNNVGSSHICFNVNEFDSIFNKVKSSGAKLAGEVCVIPGGPNRGKKVLYFEDPDGNTIEFISREVYE